MYLFFSCGGPSYIPVEQGCGDTGGGISLIFKDPADCRAEPVVHFMFTITKSTLQPVLATALVFQTLTEQAKVLRQGLTSSQMPKVHVELADYLVQGLKFVMRPLAQPHSFPNFVSAVVLWRVLWLKCWLADQTFKKALADLLLQGDQLFRGTLDDIIKNLTGGKSTFLPQSKKGKESRRRTGPTFTAHEQIFHPPGSAKKVSKSFKAPTGGAKRPWPSKASKPTDKSPLGMKVCL